MYITKHFRLFLEIYPKYGTGNISQQLVTIFDLSLTYMLEDLSIKEEPHFVKPPFKTCALFNLVNLKTNRR